MKEYPDSLLTSQDNGVLERKREHFLALDCDQLLSAHAAAKEDFSQMECFCVVGKEVYTGKPLFILDNLITITKQP